jgi:hypothetical protein
MRDVDWSPRQYGFLFAINRPPLAASTSSRSPYFKQHLWDSFRAQQFVQCFYPIGSETEANPRLQKIAVGFAQPH